MAMGVDEASARAFVAQNMPPAEDVRVLPANWPAVQVFMACFNAWLFHPVSGKPVQLLRSEVLATMDLMDVQAPKRRDTFDRVRAIEQAVLGAKAE